MRGTLVATSVILVALAGYALSCIVWPFADCRLCSGRGHFRNRSKRKLSRPCWWCDRTGKRLRIGRRLWNRARRVHRDAGVKVAR